VLKLRLLPRQVRSAVFSKGACIGLNGWIHVDYGLEGPGFESL